MEYRCVATSVEGFVQQLAVAYVTHGYWFYVAGQVPADKDPTVVDRKLVERYGVAVSKWARARRKRQGLANMQYLRHERTFVLLATKGRHEFFERERASIRDIRRVPVKFAGYSIGCRKARDGRWHAAVRIESSQFADFRAHAEEVACQETRASLFANLRDLTFEPYAGVRRQLLRTVRSIDRRRRVAGLEPVGYGALRLRRRIEAPFAPLTPGHGRSVAQFNR